MFVLGMKNVLLAVLSLLLVGCAATLKAPELGLDHPANPSARESSLPQPSSTLQSYRHSLGNENPAADGPANEMQSMDHSQHAVPAQATAETAHEKHGAEHAHAAGASGQPGKADQAAREIEIRALDTMRYLITYETPRV
jgi:hypothetical protein